jgi:hypothetical protein
MILRALEAAEADAEACKSGTIMTGGSGFNIPPKAYCLSGIEAWERRLYLICGRRWEGKAKNRTRDH